MEPCARLLRHHANGIVRPDAPNRQQTRMREKILAVGLSLLAAYGRASITASRLALALNIQTSTLRRHFIDMDELLAELLMDELRRLSILLAAIPADTPNRQAACRAAWLDATRRLGAHTEAHTLLIRELPLLPDDLRVPLQQTLDLLGHSLAGENGAICLGLLSLPCLDGPAIERMLATLPATHEPHAPAEPEPAPPPAPTRAARPRPAAQPTTPLDPLIKEAAAKSTYRLPDVPKELSIPWLADRRANTVSPSATGGRANARLTRDPPPGPRTGVPPAS